MQVVLWTRSVFSSILCFKSAVSNQLSHGCQFYLIFLFAATPKSDDETRKSSTTFQCQKYRIPIEFQCDGLVHCVPDGTDETDCQGIEFSLRFTFPPFFSPKRPLIFNNFLTANIFESGPMLTPWNFLDRPPLLPSCKLG